MLRHELVDLRRVSHSGRKVGVSTRAVRARLTGDVQKVSRFSRSILCKAFLLSSACLSGPIANQETISAQAIDMAVLAPRAQEGKTTSNASSISRRFRLVPHEKAKSLEKQRVSIHARVKHKPRM